MKMLKSIAVIAALLAPLAHANLITNGSFEDNTVSKNNWTWFTSDNVNGWDGSNIEIWNNFGGVLAQDGNQFIELNAHGDNQGAWSIYQSFATVVGQRYQLSFAYRARTSANEQFSFSVADLLQSFNNNDMKDWTVFSGSFVAKSTTSVLTFTSLTSGTKGNFIDNVSVEGLRTPQLQSVPTGPLAPLMALAAGLLWWRRRNA
jgi:uncharacterized protein (TIGR03382 family)